MKQSQFIVRPGRKVRLSDYDPASTGTFASEAEALSKIRRDCATLAILQDKLLAQGTTALLLVFQAMDGAGKDGTIKHVMSGVDPQGCAVSMFEEPTARELRHDYLWRFSKQLPERGQIGIFNRSYYEEVLSTRVHPERLAEQKLPRTIRESAGIWRQRYAQINNFEQYLSENGIMVMKFFLHLSKERQRERLLERLERPEKKWKFSMTDIEERRHWDEYARAFEETLTMTSTRRAPWHVIPADQRWFSALTVAELVVAKLKALKLRYPPPDDARQLIKAKKLLKDGRRRR